MDTGITIIVALWAALLLGLFFVAVPIRNARMNNNCEASGGTLLKHVSVDCGSYSYAAYDGTGAPWACLRNGEIIWFIEAGSHDVITYEEFCGDLSV